MSIAVHTGLGLLPALCGGCLVPLPLEQQNAVDGGQILMVKDATPAFGVQVPTTTLTPFRFSVNVQSDSPILFGRLFQQFGNCCLLQPDNTAMTRFVSNAVSVQLLSQDMQVYQITFGATVPCSNGPNGSLSGMTTYIVPVLTSGGFVDGRDGVGPAATGNVDQSHYWSVACP